MSQLSKQCYTIEEGYSEASIKHFFCFFTCASKVMDQAQSMAHLLHKVSHQNMPARLLLDDNPLDCICIMDFFNSQIRKSKKVNMSLFIYKLHIKPNSPWRMSFTYNMMNHDIYFLFYWENWYKFPLALTHILLLHKLVMKSMKLVILLLF